MTIAVRPLSTPAELAQVERVQKLAWGMVDLGVVPKEIMRAIVSNGGFVLGAFEGGRMVGMSLTLAAMRRGKAYMYSHITGVARARQSEGVGFLLKKKQKEICSRRGYDLIAWTFDPLLGRNAYFNFSKLGVVSRTYFVDYYGRINDKINFGWDTDRFLAESYLRGGALRTIREAKRSGRRARGAAAHEAVATTERDGRLLCRDWSVDTKADAVLVRIPWDAVELKLWNVEEARRWRMATREVFTGYFRAGFSAVDLLKSGRRLSYLLERVSLPRNIFGGDE